MLAVDLHDDVMFDIKRLEGRRWHPELRTWSTPPSLRAWKKLSALGFSMLEYGGGQAYVEWLQTGSPVSILTTPADLFPFQRKGVAWLRMRSHAILGDDPGLGKTYQAIAWASESERVLVASPRVVLDQWQQAVSVRLGKQATVRRAETEGWNVVNWEFLPKVAVPESPFDLIVDEAHLLGNPKARRTKLTMQLAERAKRVLLLTGTPPSRVAKWWPLLLMLRERTPKEFFPWALRYTGAEHNGYGWNFNGATHLDELADELAHVMLRRTKAEVLPDLPAKIFTTIQTESKKAELKALSALDQELQKALSLGYSLSTGAGLGTLQRLRVEASRVKIASTVEWVLAQGVPQTKVIVFGEFLDSLHTIGDGIIAGCEDPLNVVYLTGETADRAPLIQQFWDDPSCGVALCQYQAAGVGANLHCASTVVIHDLPWTPADLAQASDRAHRIGQTESVHVVTMLSESVSERQMLTGLQRHQSITDALYGPSL